MERLSSTSWAPPAWALRCTQSFDLAVSLPVPTLGFLQGYTESLKYLPIAFPFAILTVIGGVNVTESARVGGDDYNTQGILITEAVATLVAGFCGGVARVHPRQIANRPTKPCALGLHRSDGPVHRLRRLLRGVLFIVDAIPLVLRRPPF